MTNLFSWDTVHWHDFSPPYGQATFHGFSDNPGQIFASMIQRVSMVSSQNSLGGRQNSSPHRWPQKTSIKCLFVEMAKKKANIQRNYLSYPQRRGKFHAFNFKRIIFSFCPQPRHCTLQEPLMTTWLRGLKRIHSKSKRFHLFA